jgi:hypothetical protein
MSRVIEITVAPDGKATVQTKGFTGPECQDASQFIERALGQTVDEIRTAEFFQSVESERIQQRQ